MSEHQQQAALFEWANKIAALEQHPELWSLFAIPNVGTGSAFRGAWMKAEGLKPGIPDTFLPIPRWGYHGYFIELKDTGKKPKKHQEFMMEYLANMGYKVDWFDDWELAANALINYLTGRIQHRRQ